MELVKTPTISKAFELALLYLHQSKKASDKEILQSFRRLVTINNGKALPLADITTLFSVIQRVPPSINGPYRSIDERPKYLHELLQGSAAVIAPPPPPKPKDPKLVARLARLKEEQENREYLRMVKSVTQTKDVSNIQASMELTNFGSQFSIGVNSIAALGTAFAIGYFLGSGYGRTMGLVCGLLCSIIGLMIEMWLFVISGSKLDAHLAKRSKRKPTRKSKIMPDIAGLTEQYER